jgi:heterodisulfide reductase subunit A
MMAEKVGAVLILGGGIAGIQAGLDLADSGFKVYMLEKLSSIGGVMTQLDKTFPTNDCAMCIELITYTDLKGVKGEEGNFRVALNRRARSVDPDKCTGCGDCVQKCPVSAIDEYNEGFSERRSIYIRYPQAIPSRPSTSTTRASASAAASTYATPRPCPSPSP